MKLFKQLIYLIYITAYLFKVVRRITAILLALNSIMKHWGELDCTESVML